MENIPDFCKIKILVQNNDHSVCDEICNNIKRTYINVSVRSTCNTFNSLTDFKTFRPDIFIFDIGLNSKSYELIKLMNILGFRSHIIVTGDVDLNVIAECVENKATGYVFKPIDYDQMYKTIDDTVEHIFINRLTNYRSLNFDGYTR